jgi:hypothetical protein
MPSRSNHGEVLLSEAFLPLGSETTNTETLPMTYTNRHLSEGELFGFLFFNAFIFNTRQRYHK